MESYSMECNHMAGALEQEWTQNIKKNIFTTEIEEKEKLYCSPTTHCARKCGFWEGKVHDLIKGISFKGFGLSDLIKGILPIFFSMT